MTSCDYCQAQLLEHLYGLLEPDEAQALQTHLEQCAGCREALGRAQAQRQLLAAAAKTEFAALRFEAPPAGASVAEVRTPAIRWFQSGRAPWAVAATVLLAIAGLWGRNQYAEYASRRDSAGAAQNNYRQLVEDDSRLAADRQARLEETRKELADAQSKLNRLVAEQQKALNNASERLQKNQMYLAVIAPPNLQPGAPNDIRVETRNLFQGLVAAHLSAEVRDRAHDDELVYAVKDVPTAGQQVLRLPPDLPVKPDADLYLDVVAKADGREVKLTERLALLKSMYVTHLATDKPMYQPGQKVYFRSLTLQRFNFKPPTEEFRLVYTITSPQGQEVFKHEGARLADERSICGGVCLRPVTHCPPVGPGRTLAGGIRAEYSDLLCGSRTAQRHLCRVSAL